MKNLLDRTKNNLKHDITMLELFKNDVGEHIESLEQMCHHHSSSNYNLRGNVHNTIGSLSLLYAATHDHINELKDELYDLRCQKNVVDIDAQRKP